MGPSRTALERDDSEELEATPPTTEENLYPTRVVLTAFTHCPDEGIKQGMLLNKQRKFTQTFTDGDIASLLKMLPPPNLAVRELWNTRDSAHLFKGPLFASGLFPMHRHEGQTSLSGI